MMKNWRAPLLLGVLLLAMLGGMGQEATLVERNGWAGDTRGVVPRMATPPVCDGVIRPAEWTSAAEFNAQLSQGWGIDGHHLFPRDVTWYLGWDAEHLYLASRTVLLENERPRRTARGGVGTAVMSDDTLEMWLDPKGRNGGKELASYFQTMVSALGVTYFARVYPSVGAKTDTWDPHWKINTSIHDNYLDIEIVMPVAGFALANNKAGDTWGMMLARNFMFNNWNQSPLAYEFPGFGFAVNSYYPLMTLEDKTPYVKFHSPLALYAGKAYVNADIYNPGAATRVKAVLDISKGKTPIFNKEMTLELPAGGKAPCLVDMQTDPAINIAEKAVYRYDFTVTSADGAREIFHTHFSYDPTESREWLTMKFPPPPQLNAVATFNPMRSMLQASTDVIDFPRKAEIAAARTLIADAAGKTVAEGLSEHGYRDLYTYLVQMPPLGVGKYSWTASVTLKDGTSVAAGTGSFEKKDEAKEFPWWNYAGGNAEKVLWPYTALSAEKGGAVLKAWGKELHLDGLALPTQILSTGNSEHWPAGRSGTPEVLAAPVTLQAVINGKATPVKPDRSPKLGETLPYRITLEGHAAAGPLQVTTRTKFEQDGAYFVELTLAPAKAGQPVQVDAVDLSIPLRAQVATFLDAYAHCGYSGYFIDALPKDPLPGTQAGARCTVWTPALNGAPSVTVGDFTPQIWMGNEFRGLLWYADNDQGWTPGPEQQQIDRTANAAILVHHLIRGPFTLSAPRTIAFVLQPTPIRPLQPGWRMLNSSFSQSFMDASSYGRDSANYSPMVNLASAAAYAKSLAFSRNWPANKAKQPNRMMYFAPHTESSAIMTSDWPARNYFGGEWEGGTYTKTLNDHTLWYINKWIVQGGLQGLYHDQFSPHQISSASSGLAYLLPDGRIQPGFALTTRREFVMREHALWMEKGIIPPRTLTHTTNGAPLGSLGWVESCVDGEDKLITKTSGLDFADTWPSERIRAGSISYNFGPTFSWMRLIDTKGMSQAEIDAQTRTYIGHCMLHDVIDPDGFDNLGSSRTDALLAWGMNDDHVFFWPFWSNGDVLHCATPEIKVSAWTLPDRVLLCLFNYSKTQAGTATLTFDAAKLGITLPPTAAASVLSPTAGPAPLAVTGTVYTFNVPVGKRDYTLVSIK